MSAKAKKKKNCKIKKKFVLPPGLRLHTNYVIIIKKRKKEKINK